MIGCERLCGKCEACRALRFVLTTYAIEEPARPSTSAYPLGAFDHGAHQGAVENPSALAELLSRALRGRGVDAWADDTPPGRNNPRTARVFLPDMSLFEATPAEARAALARALATDTAEAAIAALEGR